MNELVKPCERLKLLSSYQKLLSREIARLFESNDPGRCFALACFKARGFI